VTPQNPSKIPAAPGDAAVTLPEVAKERDGLHLPVERARTRRTPEALRGVTPEVEHCLREESARLRWICRDQSGNFHTDCARR